MIKCFDSNKTMSFKVSDKKLIKIIKNDKKIHQNKGKISSLNNKEFDSESIYGDSDKYIKTKIKSYGDKIDTNFQGKKNTKRKYIIQIFAIDNAKFPFGVN